MRRYYKVLDNPAYRGHITNITLRDRVCDPGCAGWINKYYSNVEKSCEGQEVGGKPMHDRAAYLLQALKETCHEDDMLRGEAC